MCNFKKVLAMVLAVAMMLSVAVVAFAGSNDEDDHKYVFSPTKGDTTIYMIRTDDGAYGGITTETHKNGDTIAFKDNNGDKTVSTPMVSDVSAKKAGTLISVAGIPTGYKYSDTETVKVREVWYYDQNNNPVYHTVTRYKIIGMETKEIQQIGTGAYGIGANDEGQNVTGLNVKSKAPVVTVASRALADSNIANVVIDADNVQINKNATKGTKAKTIAFAFPQMTKSKQLVIKKGAFNGAKKVRIVVSPKMTSKELKKLKKRLKKQLGANAYKKVKIVRSAA